MKPIIVIPARMASTRFPNKPLAPICGKPMIERVWNIAKAVGNARVYIATDDERLFTFATSFGAEVIMTSSNCLTGTDRVAEVAQTLDLDTIYFNLQGDALLTPPWVITSILETMKADLSIQMATPAVPLMESKLLEFVKAKGQSSSGTTVVFNLQGDALYFSKAIIPYRRDNTIPIYRHIGLYAYRYKTLLKLQKLPEGPLERAEKLEQLRALENGIPIRVVAVDYKGRTHGSVDRPEDVAFVEQVIAREGELV